MSRSTYRNIITSDEHDRDINKKNIKLSEQFLRDKGRNVSELTIRNYRSDIRIFMTWNLLNNDNKHFSEIERIEFSDFFAYASDNLLWGSARMNRMRSCLSSFSQFVAKFFYREFPEFRNVILEVIESVPKEVRRKKTVLSDSDVDNLLKHLSERNSQMACFVALAISGGARVSELLRFTVSTIDDADDVFDGIFIHTATEIKSKGRGKAGHMTRKYVLKESFVSHFEKWKLERADVLERLMVEDHDFMFIKKNGHPATDGTVRSWIRYMSKFLEKDIYPHSFRHRCTTFLRQKGIPKDLVQHLLNWKSAEMVSLYDDTEITDKSFPELDALKEK